MVHEMDKDLPTIISTVKRVRIILIKERLASILRISNEGNTITWTPIKSLLMRNLIGVSTQVVRILVSGNGWEKRLSIGSPQIINFTTSNNCDYFWNEKNNVWIPQAEEDRLQEYELSSFHSIKKTTHTGIGASSSQPDGEVCEENESYDFSELVESTCRYANELSGPHIENNVVLIVGRGGGGGGIVFICIIFYFAYPYAKLNPSSLIWVFMPKCFTPFYSLFS
ncbi:hypothetical protein M9H77_35475 [Catharanthus roseus]|uniref:Uncharacterized protein n=1 Tax=Catharanthus roseus TaxID=4058 RepID=A0ACB9ZPV2_CATRO|nr:hypothetical protein M9H77_35475 [Catharanthus roseus]